jgi:hypothetical protein
MAPPPRSPWWAAKAWRAWPASAERASFAAVVQVGGYGYRLKSSITARGVLHRRSAGATADALYQRDVCPSGKSVADSRHTSIEQKLCRWLLERLDRSLSTN